MIVVGAGPAGSVTAQRLAGRGASVLLLDRARFPREKPCGGGVTIRAARLLPFSLDPVVEDVIDRVELRLRYRRSFERVRARPLVLMTHRSRLDAFLVEQAAAAGVVFRDGVRVREVRTDERSAAVELDGTWVEADAVVGADGANGVTAHSLALCSRPSHGVALEGNVPHKLVDADRYRGRILLELGVVPGGYGWVFPKGDHVNVGVGGWSRTASTLRAHLARLCHEHGMSTAQLESVRGHRLPGRRPGAVLGRGRGLVVGDAAGLVDPFTGDGIYEAFLSAKLAAEEVTELLAGRVRGLDGYNARIRRALDRQLSNAWVAKLALEGLPWPMFTAARLELVQSGLERLVRDEVGAGRTSRLSRASLGVLGMPLRGLGRAGHAMATSRFSQEPATRRAPTSRLP